MKDYKRFLDFWTRTFFSNPPKMEKSEVVDSLPKLKRLARKMSKISEFAFDTETNTLRVVGLNNDFLLVGISISWGKNNNYYIPVNHRRYEDIHRNIPEKDLRKYLKPVFERENVRIVGHNIKFDMHVMSRIGINIMTKDLFDTMVASFLIDENTSNGLKENSQYYFGYGQSHFTDMTKLVPNEVKKQFGLKSNSRVTFDLVLIDDGAVYAIDDAFCTWSLYLVFLDLLAIEKMEKIMFSHYVPFLRTLYDMEERGAVIDIKHLKEMETSIQEDMENLTFQLYDLAGVEFNIGSNQQLNELLFGYVPEKKAEKGYTSELLENTFGLKPVSATATGSPQVNADSLIKLSRLSYKNKRKAEGVKFCTVLLEYKKLAKLYSAFIEGMQAQIYDDGKVHPSFNITGAITGRLSCSEPNLQQLPKAEEEDKYQIRSLFIGSEYFADENGDFVCDADNVNTEEDCEQYEVKRKKIVAGDFSNLEMRVLAHFSEDKNLLEMFANDSDTHGSTAVNMFELDCKPEEVKKKYPHLRQAAKVINFLLNYGGGAFTLYNNLKNDPYNPIDLGDKSYLEKYHVKKGEEVAQIYIDKYFETYSGVAQMSKDFKRFAHKHGYIQTLLRRKRRLPEINSDDFKLKAKCERLCVNSPIQGSAADITSAAQNRVNSDPWYVEHGVYMIVQVHDELVFECPEKYVDECIRRTKAYMEHPFGDDIELNLALRADFDSGDSYQEAK